MKTTTEETETKDEYSRTLVTTTEGNFEAVEYINFKDGIRPWFDGYTTMDKL